MKPPVVVGEHAHSEYVAKIDQPGKLEHLPRSMQPPGCNHPDATTPGPWSELSHLESHTGWQPKWGSLAEDLIAKTDEAQAFIAANLQALGAINRGLALGEKVRVFNSQETAPELLRLLAKPSDGYLRTPSLRELATALASFQGGKG